MRRSATGPVIAALAAASLLSPIQAGPPLISSTITYQGELLSSNAQFNGLADFQFSIYGVLAGGVAEAGPIQLNNVTVLDGRFTVPLTFGSSVFDGSNRYLEVAVRIPAGAGGFTTLAPRQRITAAPYSLQTRGIFVSSGGFAGIGTPDPQVRLHVDDGSDSAPASGGYVVIGDVIGLNLSLDNNEIMARNNGVAASLALNASGGNVGIGTTAPEDRLHIIGGTDSALAGGGYLVLGATNSTNISIDNNEIMARNNGGISNLALNVAGGDVNLVQNGGGNVGIGTNAANARLHVVGGTDVSPASGGQLVVGSTSSLNLAIDNNEIMARNNGGTATLFLNAQGGTVAVGDTGFANLDVTGNIFGASLDVTGNVFGSSFGGQFFGAVNTNSHAALLGRDGGNGALVQWSQDGVPCGTIAVFNGVVSYNAFTGSHYGCVESQQPPMQRGTLVRMTGVNRRSGGDSEIIYGIEPTVRANDPACLGAYLGIEETTAPPGDDNPYLVMAVGNGEMWVLETTGDIKPGDALISSDVAGCAMKDDPRRFSVGYVIARAGQGVDWSEVETGPDGKKRALISVHFGAFTRTGGDAVEAIEVLRRENAELRAAIQRLARRIDERP